MKKITIKLDEEELSDLLSSEETEIVVIYNINGKSIEITIKKDTGEYEKN